jgi:hypothetical protein
MPEPKKKKIMVQLWNIISEGLDKQFSSLHLKRDAYLNSLFAREIERLATEVTSRNSDAVRQRFNERKLPNRVKLTMELDEIVVVRIDDVLSHKNIPRDAFVNRVLFFLLAKKPVLESLAISFKNPSEAVVNPLDGVRSLLADPLSHIRHGNDGRFYTLAPFPDGPILPKGPNLFALNVAIPEEDWHAMNAIDDNFLSEPTARLDEVASTSRAEKPASSMAEVFARNIPR